MSGLKNRIYIHNGIIIITIVVILEGIFLFGIKNFYIKSIELELLNKGKVSDSFYNQYLRNASIGEKARYILETDSKDQHVYMQVFNKNRIMLTDSNGFHGKKPNEAEDIMLALQGKIEIIHLKGNENKESIMAISVPLYDSRSNILGVLRYITSTTDMEKVVSKITSILLLIGNSIIVITFVFSSFLANRIITPIKELTHIAQKMAQGDFSHRSLKRHDDEVGTLSDTLNYMADEIAKSNAVKNEFISSVTHELRTPLTAIKGWSEIMLTGEINSCEEAKQGLQIIASETDRLIGLVEELLDFSKFESGRVVLTLEKINIKDLVYEVCNYFKKRVEKEGIQLSIHMENKPYFVMGDVNRLKQVFINIIDNAIKFSRSNGLINIHTYKTENKVLIKIEDHGIGISKDEIKKVTEKFYKGKSKSSGSGIGLAICKEIISMHGGNLSIESIENKGTTVIIEFLTNL